MKDKNITMDDLALMMKKGFDGVDKKLDELRTETKIDIANLEERIDRKLEKMEERFNQKLDKLTTTLDKFLEKMTSLQQEFTMMQNDIRRVKEVIKQKLGVDLL